MKLFYDMRNYDITKGVPVGIGEQMSSGNIQALASRLENLGALFTIVPNDTTFSIPLDIIPSNNIEIYICASRQLFTPNTTYNNRGVGIRLENSEGRWYEVALNNADRKDMRIYYNGGSWETLFLKNDALPQTLPPTNSPLRPDWVNMRVRVFNDDIHSKVWKGEAHEEPLEWTGVVAGGANLEFSQAKIYLSDHGATSILRYVSVGLDGEVAPPPVTRTVSGQVLLPDNSPAQGATVRVVFRETGSIVAEAITDTNGNFSEEIITGKSVPLQVIATDSVGNTYDTVGVDIL